MFDLPDGLPPPLPTVGTRAYNLLQELANGPLDQTDGLALGQGWRMAAAVFELRSDGWPIESRPIYAGRARIARYALTPRGLRLLQRAMNPSDNE